MPPVQNVGHTICSLEMRQDLFSVISFPPWIQSLNPLNPQDKTGFSFVHATLKNITSAGPWSTEGWDFLVSPKSRDSECKKDSVLTSLHCLKSRCNLQINLRVTCLYSINLTFMITCVRIGVGNIIIKHHLISRWAFGFVNSFGFMSHPLTFWQETPEGAENVPCRGQPFED